MKLANSFSVFFYAFKLSDNSFFADNAIWKRSVTGPEKNYFFKHVQDFFTKNAQLTGNAVDASCCLLYELNREPAAGEQKEKLLLINNLFSRQLQTANEPALKFKLVFDNSVLSPKLLYHPLTDICILSFSTVLNSENNTLENLVELNHQLRVFSRNDIRYFQVSKNLHPAAAEKENIIAEKIKGISKDTKPADAAAPYYHCNMDVFINELLQHKPTITLSPNRLQVFTYLQTANRLNDEELETSSFRLRRVYNRSYTPNKEFMKASDESIQMFEEIHFGASIEGCAVIVNQDYDQLPMFLKGFDAVVKHRLLWSYILAYYQRLALIEMNGKIALLYDEEQPKKESLFKVLSDLSKIQLRSLFTQVSYYSQHNEFYVFCKKNLKLDEMFGEVKDKLTDIDRILQQELSEAEKQKEKKREQKDRILEVMIAALLIPEIIFEFFSTLAHVFEIKFPAEDHHVITYFLLGIITLLMLTVIPFAVRIYKEYFHVIISYIKKREPDDDAGFKKTFVD